MSGPLPISINICSWQAPPLLDQTLASIAGQKGLEHAETILVNNGFAPERATQLQKRHGFLRIVDEPVTGHVHARRTGFRASRGEFILCLDDDNFLRDDFLPLLLDLIGRHSNLGCIRPVIVPVWEAPPPEWLKEYGLYCLSYTHLAPPVGEVLNGERISAYPDFLHWGRPPGGGMIIHRSLAENYLSSSEASHLRLGQTGHRAGGSEDIDILDRLPLTGRDGAFCERLVVYHHIPRRRTEIPYLLRLNFQRNRDCAICERLMLHDKNPFASDTRRAQAEKARRMLQQWKRGEMDGYRLALEIARPLGFFYGWIKDALREALSRLRSSPG
jgi:glycosyltransferase involved in cell wall biosynthesis